MQRITWTVYAVAQAITVAEWADIVSKVFGACSAVIGCAAGVFLLLTNARRWWRERKEAAR